MIKFAVTGAGNIGTDLLIKRQGVQARGEMSASPCAVAPGEWKTVRTAHEPGVVPFDRIR